MLLHIQWYMYIHVESKWHKTMQEKEDGLDYLQSHLAFQPKLSKISISL